MKKAKERQNQIQFDQYFQNPAVLGPFSSYIFRDDPKHLLFMLARYKFVSKMLAGKKDILEIGCGDAFGTPIVADRVKMVYAVDWEPILIKDNQKRLSSFKNIKFSILDITKKSLEQKCDGAFALDVIEHIKPTLEEDFFVNICRSLKKDGVLIIGTPNAAAKKYASLRSRQGHINLKSYQDLQKLMGKYFCNSFLFSMNDEVVHSGFYPLAHYLLAVGVGVK